MTAQRSAVTAELTDTATALPRIALATLPTPLHPAPRLSAELGLEIWFKRDDLTGLGLGGNKVRLLEFLLGDALARGCDMLVTGAGPQSNWAFLAALAAQRCGLATVLCFYGDPPPTVQGNLLLQRLTGAEIRWSGDPARESVDAMIEATAAQLRAAGHRPLPLPRGGATARGAVGYATASRELADQTAAQGATAQGPPVPTVWLATGSCVTQAGLLVGRAAGCLAGVVGVTVSRAAAECRERVHGLAGEAAALLGQAAPAVGDVDVRDGWIGSGYGKASSEGQSAAELVARTEGVLLDPVFGAKGMAALVDAARCGAVTGPVVFLVTGGAPALFVDGGANL